MSDPQTIREHWEQTRDEAAAYLRQTLTDSAYNPAVGAMERIHAHAVAALDLMDRCKFDVLSISESGDRSTLCRSVPDPQGPDPAPRGDAE